MDTEHQAKNQEKNQLIGVTFFLVFHNPCCQQSPTTKQSFSQEAQWNWIRLQLYILNQDYEQRALVNHNIKTAFAVHSTFTIKQELEEMRSLDWLEEQARFIVSTGSYL